MKGLFPSTYIQQWDSILHNASHIVVATHTRPDGDAIGSVTGLSAVLRDKGLQVDILIPTPYPSFLHFLDESNQIVVYQKDNAQCDAIINKADLIIAVDVSGFSRMGLLGERLREKKACKILMDHHPEPHINDFTLTFSTIFVSSACELVFRVIKEWNPLLAFTPAQATSFLTGIITDTNQFANSILPETFLVASELMAFQADHSRIIATVYGTYSYNRMRLMGYALQKMKLYKEWQLGVITLTKDELAQFQFQEGDTEGFVNLPLSIEGVRIAALFMERDGFVKVSLRSRGTIPVNGIASSYFHGGGHFNAAAGETNEPISQVESLLLQALAQDLHK